MLNRKVRTARTTTSEFVRSAISGTEVYEAPTVDVMLLHSILFAGLADAQS